MRYDEKEGKKFESRIPFILDPGKKITKNIVKKLKTSFQYYFLPKRDEIGLESVKKNLVSKSVHTRLGLENSEKNSKKIKKLKNLFLALFLAKTGRDRLRKQEKNFSPEFRSNSTRTRKFRKK